MTLSYTDIIIVEKLNHSINQNLTSSDCDENIFNNNVCVICLCELNKNDPFSIEQLSNCRHMFHKDCLMRWINQKTQSVNSNKSTCPTCREFIAPINNIISPYGPSVIGPLTFKERHSLVDIIVPDYVTVISSATFMQCTTLRSIILPPRLLYITTNTFNACKSLITIVLPPSITFIGGSAFAGCSSLTNIVLSPNLTFIGKSAFERCTSLTNIVLSPNISFLSEYAFKGCTALTSIVLPLKLITIACNTFEGCTSLITCTSSRDLVLPSSLMYIGTSAFEGCTSLTGVILPAIRRNRTLVINKNVFKSCPSLQLKRVHKYYLCGFSYSLILPVSKI